MATVSRPVAAWIASIQAGASVSAGSSTTITVNVTAGWEIHMPVRVIFSRVSADPSVQIYSSSDGGATFDTTAFASFSVGRVATGQGQATIRLPTGQYVVQFNAYTSSDAVTFQALTQVVITAINNA